MSNNIKTAENVTLQTANHAYSLAMGLTSVAPPSASTGGSIEYLKKMSIYLQNTSHAIAKLNPNASPHIPNNF